MCEVESRRRTVGPHILTLYRRPDDTLRGTRQYHPEAPALSRPSDIDAMFTYKATLSKHRIDRFSPGYICHVVIRVGVSSGGVDVCATRKLGLINSGATPAV